jgi:HK97 family phage major capsid protein
MELRSREDLRRQLRGGLQADVADKGGYLVKGELFAELINAEALASVMRRICRVIPPITGDSLPVPSQDALLSDATWTNELGTGSDDTSTPFGRRTLHPHPLVKRIRVSSKLLRTAPNADAVVIDMMTAAAAAVEECAFLQGDGVGQPLGVLNTPDLAVVTTAASAALDADSVRHWLYSLPSRFYGGSTRVVTTADFLRHLLALKDAGGHYVFDDYNGNLLGIPVSLTDGLPAVVDGSDALIGGAYAALIGDWRWFWIGDGIDAGLVQSTELYVETNEVGYFYRRSVDGLAVIASAFCALQIKA